MKERAIVMNDADVLAVLDGRKTQIRRIVSGAPAAVIDDIDGWRNDAHGTWYAYSDAARTDGLGIPATDFIRCPYGVPGDRLWVREGWRAEELGDSGKEGLPMQDGIRFRADNVWTSIENTAAAAERWMSVYRRGQKRKWRRAASLPHWAARLKLALTSVSVERLQDISDEDARWEGIGLLLADKMCKGNAVAFTKARRKGRVAAFAWLHRAIWDSNPWVWVLKFALVKP